MADFQELESWASALLSNVDAKSRKELARKIAKDLRQANQKRIAAQTDPDGTAYAPRKPQRRQGAIRRGMFNKLRLAKYLKAQSGPNAAVVDFTMQVSRIAKVHQFGLRDRVSRNGPETQYTARPLIGISQTDIQKIGEMVINTLAK
ncbi:phage virion morphogenesis protein [Iodobacter sp.]|uniref:phage virion morphogenesis protein n=1 Tax=Iodobacter sp. TaxID=1915058 RepID=UPI0025DB2958|nr:phage virion morphogenesis protein [Iodobacter sp.]